MFRTPPPPHPHRYPYPTPSQTTNCSNLFCPIDHRTSQYRTRIFPTFPIEVTQRGWSKIAKFRWTYRAVKGNKPRKPGKEINEINQKLWIKGWYKYDDIFTWQGVLRSSTFFIVYMFFSIPMLSLTRLCVLSLPSFLWISERDSWWNISCILNFCGYSPIFRNHNFNPNCPGEVMQDSFFVWVNVHAIALYLVSYSDPIFHRILLVKYG